MFSQALGYTGQGLVSEKHLPRYLTELLSQHGFPLKYGPSAPGSVCPACGHSFQAGRRPVWPGGLHCCSLISNDSPRVLTQPQGRARDSVKGLLPVPLYGWPHRGPDEPEKDTSPKDLIIKLGLLGVPSLIKEPSVPEVGSARPGSGVLLRSPRGLVPPQGSHQGLHLWEEQGSRVNLGPSHPRIFFTHWPP